MISVSGIRGRVGAALTPEVVCRYAAAFGAWSLARCHSREIVVGRDSRTSGEMFQMAVTAGLQSVGAVVVDLGMVPTPTLQLAVEERGAAGGLAITASHNPVEWNALKFIGPSGLFLSAAEGAEMRTFAAEDFSRAGWDEVGSLAVDREAVQRHVDRILGLPLLDVEAIRQRHFRVALDTCRGAGAVILPRLLSSLGCQVLGINLTPDGRFPRPPEPLPENLRELGDLVRRSGAVAGLASDPDVDRLAVVDERGQPLGEDWTLAIATLVVLRRRPGAVVANLSTSRIVEDVAARFGVPCLRAPVGEVNVALRMREVGAVIGGEGNGGVMLPELHLGRDAPLAAALMLQFLVDEGVGEGGRQLSDVIVGFPHYVIVKDKLDFGVTLASGGGLAAMLKSVRNAFPEAEADWQDGLRLSWGDRWLHVRPSGTEPVVRVIAEAPSESSARELAARCRAIFESMALGGQSSDIG
jgi:phosphomannomutase